MALNYSHRPIFLAHIGEDSLVSPTEIVNGYIVDGVPVKNREDFTRTKHDSQGEIEERNFCCGRDSVDRCSLLESASNDVAKFLPSDPFGRDIETTFTTITGWLEDFDVNYGGYVRNNNCASNQDDCDWFARWNLI